MSSAGFHKFKDVPLDKIGPLRFRVKEDTTVKVDGETATRPITKKTGSLDFAMAYAKSALETYSWAKVEIAPIDEPLYKFAVTIKRR
ncbi:MAG: hypothetical protein IK038_02030 [Bacteroidaceae bacterium]|nr:hypothetical protein [Bacteroidaceae bacterium]